MVSSIFALSRGLSSGGLGLSAFALSVTDGEISYLL